MGIQLLLYNILPSEDTRIPRSGIVGADSLRVVNNPLICTLPRLTLTGQEGKK